MIELSILRTLRGRAEDIELADNCIYSHLSTADAIAYGGGEWAVWALGAHADAPGAYMCYTLRIAEGVALLCDHKSVHIPRLLHAARTGRMEQARLAVQQARNALPALEALQNPEARPIRAVMAAARAAALNPEARTTSRRLYIERLYQCALDARAEALALGLDADLLDALLAQVDADL